ncbi:MAG: hypothetical protein JWO97_737 [Acidobacteria bacterium]|nr:hypothetical protein [Acidobacteriota bacterium]
MTKVRFAVAVAVLVGGTFGCMTNKDAWTASEHNKLWIRQVKLGQTDSEVLVAMHTSPESTSARTLQDGTIEQTWNYLTDYDNDTNTTITFRNGRVVEITQTAWLGNGAFGFGRTMPMALSAAAPPPADVVVTAPPARPQPTHTKIVRPPGGSRRTADDIRSAIVVGMSDIEVIALVGQPDDEQETHVGTSVFRDWIYQKSGLTVRFSAYDAKVTEILTTE